MGLAFQGSGAWIGRSCVIAPLRALDRVFGSEHVHKAHRFSQGSTFVEDHSLTLGNTAFTPRRLEVSDPIFDDRPYSSLLFLTISRATIDPYGTEGRQGRMIKTDLTLGVLGLSISRDVQTAIHSARRQPGELTPYDPQGWHHQISHGGEPTLKYSVTYLDNLSSGSHHDATLQTEASIGYYTNAAGGPFLRVGWIKTPFWTFSSNPMSAGNQALGTGKRSRGGLEAYLWGAFRGRAVLYNALLQGQFRHSDVKFGHSKVEHLVVEQEVGVTFGFRGLAVILALARRGHEYNVGDPRAHTWGGLYFIFRRNLNGQGQGTP
jgi:hypothetical protein